MAPDLNERILGHAMQLRAEQAPDQRIVTFENWTTSEAADDILTYGLLWERSAKLAAELIRHRLAPGDTVAIFMRNYPEFIYAIVACSIAATPFVPIDPRQKGEKLRFQLGHAECRAVVTTSDLLPALEGVLGDLPRIELALAAARPGGPAARGPRVVPMDDVLAQPLRGTPPQRTTSLEHPIQVIYTSGTTGDPKGVVAEGARWTATAQLLATFFGYQQTDCLYTGLSLTHGNAQAVTLLPSLLLGIPSVFSPRFTKSRIWDVCRRYGCTTFSLLGGMMAAIYAEPSRPDDADNPVRFVLSAGTPRAIWEAFERRFNTRILEWYGAVEGGFAYRPIGQGPIGSFGRPVEGLMEMKLVDEHDQECPPGVVGELISRVPGSETRVEYLKNVAASAEKTRGGWLRSGDMCLRDEEGWLFFSHRKGSEIRHNGEFIQPDFIQKVIAEHPAVTDVYVYGIPARSGAPGEKDVVAAITPAQPERFEPAAIFRDCAKRLERNHIPSFLQVLPEIPKTASEKPQDRFLMKALEDRERCSVHAFEDYAGRL
jgi:crotonobetaine/carnitine-CoA ligase